MNAFSINAKRERMPRPHYVTTRRHSNVWFLFYLSKVFYMFFAVYVYGQLTTLGDTGRYLNATPEFSKAVLISSTSFMTFLGGVIGIVTGGTILTHLVFLTAAFYGIYYPLRRIDLTQKQLVAVLLIFSLPSFASWTSVIGKESVAVFFMGIILGYVIDLMNGHARFTKPIELFAMYLMAVFKPQYAIAVGHAILIPLLRLRFRRWPGWVLFFFLCMVVVDISLLYYYRDIIDALSIGMVPHFSTEAGSTRTNTIWVEQYDVFYNAPYGMMIGFLGPTVMEGWEKPLQGIVLIESLVVVSFISALLVMAIFPKIIHGKLNVLMFSMVLSVFFWILFVHYPFGALNPGSAIRYRSNFYHVFVILSMFFWVKTKNRFVSFPKTQTVESA